MVRYSPPLLALLLDVDHDNALHRSQAVDLEIFPGPKMGHRPAHLNGPDVSLDSHDSDGAGDDLGQQDLLESRVTEGGLRAFSGELNSEPAQQTRAGGSTQCRH